MAVEFFGVFFQFLCELLSLTLGGNLLWPPLQCSLTAVLNFISTLFNKERPLEI